MADVELEGLVVRVRIEKKEALIAAWSLETL